MGLDDHLIFPIGIDHSRHTTVDIDNIVVNIGLEVIQPNLLSRVLETGRGSVVQVTVEEVLALLVHVDGYLLFGKNNPKTG
jgi:hypothetical protein